MTVKEAAEQLGVSQGTIYALCARRKLRHSRVRLGRGKIRISEEAIAEYLKEGEVGPGEPRPPSLPRSKVTLKHLHL